MPKDNYTAIGKAGRKIVFITATTFDTALRAARQILRENKDITSVRVEDRKGTTVKVIARERTD